MPTKVNGPVARRVKSVVNTVRGVIARDPVERYESRHFLVAQLAHMLGGFRVYNRGVIWPEDPEFLAAWQAFPEGDRFIKDRRYVLWSMARSIASLDGDTAECGVYNGSSSWLICAAGERTPDWRHHIFDSFEGLSEPDSLDRPSEEHTFLWAKHDLAVGIERVQSNMQRFEDRIVMHPGWIPERFAEVDEGQRFSFVHVDVDLYQPTRDSIEFFYPRLVPGGILLCDDYGYASCPGAKRAFDEFIADKPESSVIQLTTGQGFIVKR